MMMASGKHYTREDLRAAIVDNFGADARFYACSADNMDADQLIDFLATKGKFQDSTAGLAIDPSKKCDH